MRNIATVTRSNVNENPKQREKKMDQEKILHELRAMNRSLQESNEIKKDLVMSLRQAFRLQPINPRKHNAENTYFNSFHLITVNQSTYWL